MIVFDYLILNEDRHFCNIGAIRNAITLEWLGIAPIFDSGTYDICKGFGVQSPGQYVHSIRPPSVACSQFVFAVDC